MGIAFDNLDEDKVKSLIGDVDINYDKVKSIVDDIVKPYCEELDNYVEFVKSIVTNPDEPPTAQELDDFCLNLSVYIYYASAMQENLGIKDDIAKAVYKDVYYNVRHAQDKGTVADKDTIAELASQQEYLVSLCYKRSYAIVKAKVLAAQELLTSCKKVISRRMTEYELTNMNS